jgi:ubiquinone/menaquinone biosynthesis C-methylase UbiE
MSSNLEKYFEIVKPEDFFRKLNAENPQTLASAVAHFSVKEAEKRDAITLSYFGEKGANRIVDAIAERLIPSLQADSKVLDGGAGSGFFTAKIAKAVNAKVPNVSFYAMDATPAMLLALQKNHAELTPFWVIAENIKGSLRQAGVYVQVPEQFDAVFSTLMLHHSAEPKKVFESLKRILAPNSTAVVLDLCEHNFEEFRTELSDVHLGFKLEYIKSLAEKEFSNVQVEKIPGISCLSSGRSAEIFVVSMKKLA